MQANTVIDTEIRRISYLDPTGDVQLVDRQDAQRLASIKGATVALMNNGNDTSGFFFEALSQIFKEQYGVARVILETKFTSSKPADDKVLEDIAVEADFMVAGVAL
ncbi:MAG: hypothetical protein VX921_01690 [Chloroflexota bacterium]|nr:hypothetical protein [Chloroflexota bacterium]|tara:strand:- start:310 stop:627 length:318 start_codon:yes stop_codon:yes gene_type:complete